VYQFAQQMQVHVQILAHPSKTDAYTRGKMPTLEDIHGSKHWDNMPDQGFSIWRPALYNDDGNRETYADAGEPDTGRNDGLASADTARQEALRSAQADSGTGVRHHQIGDGIPPVSVARVRLRSRRVEPCYHGLEHQEDVCAQPRLSALQRLRSNNGGA
jgi:hypothetical protein